MNDTTLTMAQLDLAQRLEFGWVSSTGATARMVSPVAEVRYCTGRLEVAVQQALCRPELRISPEDISRERVADYPGRTDGLERWIYQIKPTGRAISFVDHPEDFHEVHPDAPLPPSVIIALPRDMTPAALGALSITDWDMSMVTTVMCTPVGYDFAARRWMFDVEYSRTHGGLVSS